MKTREMLLKMLDQPESELNERLKELDKEETCENLEQMTLKITRIVGSIILKNAIQVRADAENEFESHCPHCVEKETLVRASFSPSAKKKKKRK